MVKEHNILQSAVKRKSWKSGKWCHWYAGEWGHQYYTPRAPDVVLLILLHYLQYDNFTPNKTCTYITYNANSCAIYNVFTIHYLHYSQFVTSFTPMVHEFMDYSLKRVSIQPQTFSNYNLDFAMRIRLRLR